MKNLILYIFIFILNISYIQASEKSKPSLPKNFDNLNIEQKIIYAITNNQDILCQYLIKNREFNINTTDNHGYSILMLLISSIQNNNQNSYTELIKYLIEEKKININITSKNGETALFLAIRHNLTGIAIYLIDNGANINAYDPSNRNSILHIAVQHTNIKLVKYLIDKGVNTEYTNQDGLTAFELGMELHPNIKEEEIINYCNKKKQSNPKEEKNE